MDKLEAASVLLRMGALWPNKPGEDTIRLWADELYDCDLEAAEATVADCQAECDFWPSFATWRELYGRHIGANVIPLERGLAAPVSNPTISEEDRARFHEKMASLREVLRERT